MKTPNTGRSWAHDQLVVFQQAIATEDLPHWERHPPDISDAQFPVPWEQSLRPATLLLLVTA